MIELERHIEILLLTNDCVIVPDLGGFMAHYMASRYDEADGTFLPPLRTLGFNPQLKLNDSLLVQSYIEAYDISYPEALRRVEAEVRELRQHLENERHYELNDLGVLHFNEEGKLEFEPCEAGILTPQLYGLSSFEMPLLNATATAQEPQIASLETVASTPETRITDDKAITIKISWLRNMVAAAAAIIAFLMIATPVSNDSNVLQSSLLPASTTTATLPMPAIFSTPAVGVSPVDAPVTYVVAPVAAPPAPADNANDQQIVSPAPRSKSYCLVLACQISQRNADAFVGQLQSAGFTDVRVTNSKNMRRVVYGSYPTENDAYDALRDLRRQNAHFKQAWVMKVKE